MSVAPSGKVCFKTRTELGAEVSVDTVLAPVTLRQKEYSGGVTLITAACYNVNATSLAFTTWKEQGELDKIERLLVVDDGSKTPFNTRVMQQVMKERGEGTVLSLRSSVGHAGVLDMIAQLDLVETPYVMFCDNDIMMMKPGIVGALRAPLENGAVASGMWIEKRGHWSTAPGMEGMWVCPKLMCSVCSMWQTKKWREQALRVYCAGWRDEARRLVWDTMASVTFCFRGSNTQFVPVDTAEFVYHFGSVTWARRNNPDRDTFDREYAVITSLLRQRGIPEEDLHDDPWTP